MDDAATDRIAADDQLTIGNAGIDALCNLQENLHRRHVVIAVGKEIGQRHGDFAALSGIDRLRPLGIGRIVDRRYFDHGAGSIAQAGRILNEERQSLATEEIRRGRQRHYVAGRRHGGEYIPTCRSSPGQLIAIVIDIRDKSVEI